jgi:hypothetical protein
MRNSALFSFILSLVLIIFSSSALAAASSVTGTSQRLPAQIKINPVDIKTKSAESIYIDMKNAKDSWTDIKQLYPKLNRTMTDMDVIIASYQNDFNACKNKVYTTVDQKNAGCTDSMTIAQCSQLLFDNCMVTSDFVMSWEFATSSIDAKKMEEDSKKLATSLFNIMTMLNNMKKK